MNNSLRWWNDCYLYDRTILAKVIGDYPFFNVIVYIGKEPKLLMNFTDYQTAKQEAEKMVWDMCASIYTTQNKCGEVKK